MFLDELKFCSRTEDEVRFVDETGDTLDTTTTSETADSGLGDTLDVVAKDLTVTLGASLSETFASFSSSGHG